MKWKQFWQVLPFIVGAYILFDYFLLSSSTRLWQSVLVGLIMGLILIILRIILDTIKHWRDT